MLKLNPKSDLIDLIPHFNHRLAPNFGDPTHDFHPNHQGLNPKTGVTSWAGAVAAQRQAPQGEIQRLVTGRSLQLAFGKIVVVFSTWIRYRFPTDLPFSSFGFAMDSPKWISQWENQPSSAGPTSAPCENLQGALWRQSRSAFGQRGEASQCRFWFLGAHKVEITRLTRAYMS